MDQNHEWTAIGTLQTLESATGVRTAIEIENSEPIWKWWARAIDTAKETAAAVGMEIEVEHLRWRQRLSGAASASSGESRIVIDFILGLPASAVIALRRSAQSVGDKCASGERSGGWRANKRTNSKEMRPPEEF